MVAPVQTEPFIPLAASGGFQLVQTLRFGSEMAETPLYSLVLRENLHYVDESFVSTFTAGSASFFAVIFFRKR
jgi:hypothetical protein